MDELKSEIGTSGRSSLALDDFLSEPSALKSLLRWCSLTVDDLNAIGLETALDQVAADVARIDRILERQLNAILHHPELQALESSWRSLRWFWTHMVAFNDDRELETPGVELKVLSVSKSELHRDFERSPTLERSNLFRKVYEQAYGTFGATPYGLLIGDYEFTNHPNDVSLLRNISHVSAAAFAPFVAAAHPSVLALESYSQLQEPVDIQTATRAPGYALWKGLRRSEDTRFVGLTLPRMLVRCLYRNDGSYSAGFRFEEDASVTDDYLWGNAAYAFAAVAARSFAETGWFADIRGFERETHRGGLVPQLPVETFGTDTRRVAVKQSVEVAIDERRERELSLLGLIPVRHCQDTEWSVFFTNQSLQEPKSYTDAVADTNARISAMLQYMLCASRFAHYLKAVIRQKLASVSDAAEIEKELKNWISHYVIDNRWTTPAKKAQRPLRRAEIEVNRVSGQSARYELVMKLQPHYQLDELVGDLRLKTSIDR